MQLTDKQKKDLETAEADEYYKEMKTIKKKKAKAKARYDSKNIIQKLLGFLHSEN